MCGERIREFVDEAVMVGSSPRVRGTAGKARADAKLTRFIPACAGNGSSRSRARAAPTVHPRVCGERTQSEPWTWRTYGSSPRVRGTGVAPCSRPQRHRFIPACAGNGTRRPSASGAHAVHPRVCGERCWRAAWTNGCSGSSPRVRGTVAGAPAKLRRRRFIPACAGNGTRSTSSFSTTTVHPRVCGERLRKRRRSLSITGSSPRVRGTDRAAHCLEHDSRFIPACAGNGPSPACRPA